MWQKSHISGCLDLPSKMPVDFGLQLGLASGWDLAPIAHKRIQEMQVSEVSFSHYLLIAVGKLWGKRGLGLLEAACNCIDGRQQILQMTNQVLMVGNCLSYASCAA